MRYSRLKGLRYGAVGFGTFEDRQEPFATDEALNLWVGVNGVGRCG